ncbi:MAG: cytochrome c [Anaerolineales bacterium]|nr:cytochrome c [Anaerolineales bacterium]
MRKFLMVVVLALVLSLVLAACGGGGEEAGESASGGIVGNPDRGKKLYEQTTIGSASAPGCITCHSLEPGVVIVGPSHAGVATRAETYVEGMSAEDYLHESIVSPDAHVVDGFTPGVMYQNFGEELNDQEIADLVAYLMTLK